MSPSVYSIFAQWDRPHSACTVNVPTSISTGQRMRIVIRAPCPHGIAFLYGLRAVRTVPATALSTDHCCSLYISICGVNPSRYAGKSDAGWIVDVSVCTFSTERMKMPVVPRSMRWVPGVLGNNRILSECSSWSREKNPQSTHYSSYAPMYSSC